jgi:ethanolamine utilization protein EutN/carbon dioxide concentrating mechanism protein CcmL
LDFAMILARVVGTVVSTKKESSMDGLRFMLVQPIDVDGKATGAQTVAVDAVGAGVGECVLFCTGSSARQTQATDKRPCDAVIMAIVDNWEVRGEVKYQKSAEEAVRRKTRWTDN